MIDNWSVIAICLIEIVRIDILPMIDLFSGIIMADNLCFLEITKTDYLFGTACLLIIIMIGNRSVLSGIIRINIK